MLGLRRFGLPDIFPAVLNRLALAVLLTALVLSGCAASKPDVDTAESLPRVYAVRAIPGDRTLTVQWRVERAPAQLFSGYNVYIVETGSVGDAQPINSMPYAGDTDGDPTSESFRAESLPNGVRYTCFVRAVGTDGRMGVPTDLVEAICRPGGEVILQPIFSGDYDGFDFSTGRHVNTDEDGCDVAFFMKDGEIHLIAPSRIDPLLHETRFWDAGAYDEFDAITSYTPVEHGHTEIVDPQVGHVYVYRTPDQHYGKMRIAYIGELEGEKTIRFEFMYQAIPDLLVLR